MLIFNYEDYISTILENGIKETDKGANSKIRDLMTYYWQKPNFDKAKTYQIIKDCAKDCFLGLPDTIIEKKLDETLNEAKKQKNLADKYDHKTITLYRSEMEFIKKLRKNQKLMELAFVFLVVHKFKTQYTVNGKKYYYKDTVANDNEIFELAKYGGVNRNQREKKLHYLCENGYVDYSVLTNPASKYNHATWKGMTRFTVPYNVDLKEDKTGEVEFIQISDYDDIFLYLDYFLSLSVMAREKEYKLCAECGKPIPNTWGSKKYCAKCAAQRIKESKRIYNGKIERNYALNY